MIRQRWARALGITCLAALSWIYCQPRHPSAGNAPALDALAHCALFAVVGFWYARTISARFVLFVPLIALAVGLEWLQWIRGDYIGIEWIDAVWNVIGLLLGWVSRGCFARIRRARRGARR
ncbi:hypothetical protein LF41_775 [Lysobacter dokdonensis DS-58]|uniref:VanZ family protein n=1 Tax=Lysobacter dokdonensis DS-58 TaxID=1300345 RepID=A0A0A2X4T8_9GAMM|nr:hypothetical protein [Lysobacter dokdonensis]KGQ20239.1 hypothetical protein LF41_775 [Lysobacter dokdonensis DS-58]